MSHRPKNRILLGLLALPILLVGGLFFVPVDWFHAGAPGLASGKLEVERLEELRVGEPWLEEYVPGGERLAATCTTAMRGGGRRHVTLVAGAGDRRVEITLVLVRGWLSGDRASAILRRPGAEATERRRLGGRLRLASDGLSGEFELRVEPAVAHGAWRGAFVLAKS